LNSSVDDLTAIEGIDGETAAKIIELATRHEEVQEQPEPEAESEEGAETETQEEAQVE